MDAYLLANFKILREFFHDRPDAVAVTLSEAASMYEAEEPRAGLYVLDEQEREFITLCAHTYPDRLLDKWLR